MREFEEGAPEGMILLFPSVFSCKGANSARGQILPGGNFCQEAFLPGGNFCQEAFLPGGISCIKPTKLVVMKILVEHILPGFHYESISENAGGAYLVGGSTMNPLQEMLVEHVLQGAPPRYPIRKCWWRTSRQKLN